MDIKNYTFIVFSEEHHYNPLGVVRSLGEEGITPDVIAYGGREQVVTSSKYVGKVYHVNTIEEGYKILIDNYSVETLKPFVITCDDRVTSFLDKRYDELKAHFFFFNAGKDGRVTYYMDKNNINILAEKHGLKVPKAYVVNRGEILDEFEYPVLTKSISSNSGGWKKDVFVCKNKEELSDAYKKIQSEVVLIQKFVEKKNELCLDGCVVNRGKDLFISISSFYNYNIPGQYAFDYNSENFKDEKLKESLEGIFEEIGFEGIFTVEFLIDQNDNLYFMEINFRNSGWSYTSTCVDMNLPIIWAEAMATGHIPSNAYKSINQKFRSIVELRDFITRVKGKKVSLLYWIKDLKNIDCFLLYNKDDPKPFWITVKKIISNKLKRWKLK